MASRPTRSSAFDGALMSFPPDGVAAADALVFQVRGDPALVHLQAASSEPLSEALGCKLPGVNSSRAQGERRILGLAWDAWLIVDPAMEPEPLLAEVDGALEGLDAAAVDLSHAWGVLRMGGAKSRDALAKICPVDLHPSAFKPGDCFRSGLARHAVLVHALDERPSFDLYVPRSTAVSFWDCLSDAAREFGYRIED